MTTASLFDIAALFADQQIPYTDAEDAVRVYTLGAAESPWRRGALAERLRAHDIESALSARVLGQPAAVTKAADILRRAVLGTVGRAGGSGFEPPAGGALLRWAQRRRQDRTGEGSDRARVR